MAARRLLIVMLVLLGISSVIAIVVPEPSQRDSDPPETAATGATGASGATGATGTEGDGQKPSADGPKVAHETVTLDGKGKPVELEVRPGSRMILTVDSKSGAVVEVRGLGLTAFSDRYAPAVFDIYIPDEPGSYAVAAFGERPVARIVTREPRPA